MRRGLEYDFVVSTLFRHVTISVWLIRLENAAISEADLEVLNFSTVCKYYFSSAEEK